MNSCRLTDFSVYWTEFTVTIILAAKGFFSSSLTLNGSGIGRQDWNCIQINALQAYRWLLFEFVQPVMWEESADSAALPGLLGNYIANSVTVCKLDGGEIAQLVEELG